MKFKFHCLLIMLALFAALTQNTRAAVAFTITPAAVSNTYNGAITFQVTGLTNTETVVLRGYLDANTNGVIDAGDVLWQQFQLTDGQQSLFHNNTTVVTNFNIPGDTDGTANGTIAAKMVFWSGSPQAISGKYVFRLYSPVNHFTAITNNQFMVTNFPYAGSFTGNVVSNGTATTLSNAIVLLFNAASGNLQVVGGAVANNAGSYTIKAPPGTYTLAAIKSNYVADTSVAANLVLGTTPITTNVNLMVATRSISGRIVDANNSSLGIAGLLVPAQTQGGLLTVAFTDTNGNFTERVNANQWKIENNEQGLMPYGYLGLQNSLHVDTTGGSVSGVTNAVPKATAIFYGSIKDNLNHPLVGIDLFSQQQDNNYLYESQGITDANGNYVAGALAGNWNIGVSSDSSPTNYLFSPGPNTTLTNGQAYLQNFTAYLATNHITGHVSFNGAPVTNVQVSANATIGVNNCQAQATTDNTGYYSLNVVNTNNWSVNVSCSGGNNSLDNILGSGKYVCPNTVGVSINNNNGTADFVVQPILPLQVNTTSLPPGAVGVFYNAQVQVSGGTQFTPGFPYGGTLLSGSLPPGLGISAGNYTSSSGDFVFSGTPTQIGTFPFVAVAYDAANTQITNSYSITVNPILSSPVILSGGKLQLSLNGNAGDYFTIAFSTNLINWVPLLVTNPPSAQPLYLDFPTTNKTGFYQAYQSGIAAGQSVFSFGGSQVFTVTVTNGAGTAVIPITRTGGLANNVCVNYTTTDGTANGGCDYTPVSGTLCFAPNATSNSISIPVSLGCDPTVQSATVNLVLSDPSGTNVITAVLVIQRPKPVLAVFSTSLNIFVPGNCGQSTTISNAGPQGSVLNYTVADDGALGGFLYLVDHDPNASVSSGSFVSGSLQAGQTAQVEFTVQDQFATNWNIGGLTTAPNIYTPGAANYSKFPISVAISPTNLTINPTQRLPDLFGSYPHAAVGMTIGYPGGSETNGDAQELTAFNNVRANASAANFGVTLNASAASSVTTSENSIILDASATAAVVFNYPTDALADGVAGSDGYITPSITFSLACSSGYSLTGTLNRATSSDNMNIHEDTAIAVWLDRSPIQGGLGDFSLTGTLSAGSHTIYLVTEASVNYPFLGSGLLNAVIYNGTYFSSVSGHATFTLTPNH